MTRPRRGACHHNTEVEVHIHTGNTQDVAVEDNEEGMGKGARARTLVTLGSDCRTPYCFVAVAVVAAARPNLQATDHGLRYEVVSGKTSD